MNGADPVSSESFNLSIDQWTSTLGIDVGQNRDAFSGLFSLHDDWLATLGLSLSAMDSLPGGRATLDLYGALVSGIRFPSLYSSELIRSIRSTLLGGRRTGQTAGHSLRGSSRDFASWVDSEGQEGDSFGDSFVHGTGESDVLPTSALDVILAAGRDVSQVSEDSAPEFGASDRGVGILPARSRQSAAGLGSPASVSPIVPLGVPGASGLPRTSATSALAAGSIRPRYSASDAVPLLLESPGQQPMFNWLNEVQADETLFITRAPRVEAGFSAGLHSVPGGSELGVSPARQGPQSSGVIPSVLRMRLEEQKAPVGAEESLPSTASTARGATALERLPSDPVSHPLSPQRSSAGLESPSIVHRSGHTIAVLSSVEAETQSLSGQGLGIPSSTTSVEAIEAIRIPLEAPSFSSEPRIASLEAVADSFEAGGPRIVPTEGAVKYPVSDQSNFVNGPLDSLSIARSHVVDTLAQSMDGREMSGAELPPLRGSFSPRDAAVKKIDSSVSVSQGEQRTVEPLAPLGVSSVHEEAGGSGTWATGTGPKVTSLPDVEAGNYTSWMFPSGARSDGATGRMAGLSQSTAFAAGIIGHDSSLGLEWVGYEARTSAGLGGHVSGGGGSDASIVTRSSPQEYEADSIPSVFPVLSKKDLETSSLWSKLLGDDRPTNTPNDETYTLRAQVYPNRQSDGPRFIGDATDSSLLSLAGELASYAQWNPIPAPDVLNRAATSPQHYLPAGVSRDVGLSSFSVGSYGGLGSSAGQTRELILPMSSLWSNRSEEAGTSEGAGGAPERVLPRGALLPTGHRLEEELLTSASGVGSPASSQLVSSIPTGDIGLTRLLRQVGAGPDSMLTSVVGLGSALSRFGQSALIANALYSERSAVSAETAGTESDARSRSSAAQGLFGSRLEVSSMPQAQATGEQAVLRIQRSLDSLRRGDHIRQTGSKPEDAHGAAQLASIQEESLMNRLDGEGKRESLLQQYDLANLSTSILPVSLAEALSAVGVSRQASPASGLRESDGDRTTGMAQSSFNLLSGDALILNAFISSLIEGKPIVGIGGDAPKVDEQSAIPITSGPVPVNEVYPRGTLLNRIPDMGPTGGLAGLHSDTEGIAQQLEGGLGTESSIVLSKLGSLSRTLFSLKSSVANGSDNNILPPHLLGEEAAWAALEAESFRSTLLEPLSAARGTHGRDHGTVSGILTSDAGQPIGAGYESPLMLNLSNQVAFTDVSAASSASLQSSVPLDSMGASLNPFALEEGLIDTHDHRAVVSERMRESGVLFNVSQHAQPDKREMLPVVRVSSDSYSEMKGQDSNIPTQVIGLAGSRGQRTVGMNSAGGDMYISQAEPFFSGGRLSSLPALASEVSPLVLTRSTDPVQPAYAGMLASVNTLESGSAVGINGGTNGPRYSQRGESWALTATASEAGDHEQRLDVAQASLAQSSRPNDLGMRAGVNVERPSQSPQVGVPTGLQREQRSNLSLGDIRGALLEQAQYDWVEERPQVTLDGPSTEMPVETLQNRAFFVEARTREPAYPRVTSPTMDEADITVRGLSESLARMTRAPHALNERPASLAGILQQPLLSREPVQRDLSGMAQDVYAAREGSSEGSHKSGRRAELEKLEKASYFSQEVSAENRAFEMALMEIRWRLKFTERWDLERE